MGSEENRKESTFSAILSALEKRYAKEGACCAQITEMEDVTPGDDRFEIVEHLEHIQVPEGQRG